MEKSYPAIKRLTAPLKSSAFFIYASYFFTALATKISPVLLPRFFIDMVSSKFTLAFSNVPGPIKPLYYEDKDGNKYFT
jgi:hypothetical protein